MQVLSELTPDHVREICERLLAEKEALKMFSASLEEEFLDLGSALRKIAGLSRELQHQGDEVRPVTLGTPLGCPMDFAFQLLNRAEVLAQGTREEYSHLISVFEVLRAELAHIARDRDALLGTLARLCLSNAQLRIEASYFDSRTRTQLFALADASAESLRALQTKVALRFEELGSLLLTTGVLSAGFNEYIAVRAKSTDDSLLADRSDLSALSDALLRSQGFASINLRGRLNIAGGVRKAMVALQCQDITRQKIEHINAGLQEIVSHISPGSSRSLTAEEESDYKHYLCDASRIQLAQLHATFEQLFGAAREVNSALQQVASEAHVGLDVSPQSGQSLVDNHIFTQGLASLAAVFNLVATEASDRIAVTTLCKALQLTFSDCTSDLLALTKQLQAVDGVTQIFAASVEGRATLKVLIQEQRTLIETAVSRLHAITPRAEVIVNSTVSLEKRLQQTTELSNTEWADLNAKADESKVTLAKIRSQLNEVVAAIRPRERQLSTAVETATQRIRFPKAVAEISSRSIALFEDFVSSFAAGSNGRSSPHQKVGELKRHYTMVGEHTIHDQTLGTTSATQEDSNEGSVILFEDEPAIKAPEQAQEEPLADNVELF